MTNVLLLAVVVAAWGTWFIVANVKNPACRPTLRRFTLAFALALFLAAVLSADEAQTSTFYRLHDVCSDAPNWFWLAYGCWL